MLSVNYYCGDRTWFAAFCNEFTDFCINRDFRVQVLVTLGNDYDDRNDAWPIDQSAIIRLSRSAITMVLNLQPLSLAVDPALAPDLAPELIWSLTIAQFH